MTRRIRDSGKALARVRDTGGHLPRVDPAVVAEDLGAEPAPTQIHLGQGPITLRAIREAVVHRLAQESVDVAHPRSLPEALEETFRRWLLEWLPAEARRSALTALRSIGEGNVARVGEIAQEIASRVLIELAHAQKGTAPDTCEEAGVRVEHW